MGNSTPKVHKKVQPENEPGNVDSALNMGQILFDAFENIGKSSAGAGLEASKWAPKTTPRTTSTNTPVDLTGPCAVRNKVL